jgi:CENP-B N-terminal DNA-binding domain
MRNSYNLNFKKRVIERSDLVNNKHEVAREFGISRKTLIEWISRRQQIEEGIARSKGACRKLHPGRRVQNSNAEERLYVWFRGERDYGRAVTNVSLVNKMRQLTGRIFKASPRWMQGICEFLMYRVEKKIFCVPESCNQYWSSVARESWLSRIRLPGSRIKFHATG